MNESWKDIEEYEDSYEVSSLGRVRSKTRTITYKTGKKHTYKAKVLKLRLDKDGYLLITLNKENRLETISVHRLVAIHFIPTSDRSLQVNHKDGNKENNTISNLEWCTVYDNLSHSYSSGLKKTKLSKQDVSEIKELYKSGNYTQKEIGVIFNVAKEHVNGIINNKKRVNV